MEATKPLAWDGHEVEKPVKRFEDEDTPAKIP
jgi:hypothetical protein